LTRGLDVAVVRFVGASALHALMLNNFYSSKVRIDLNQGSCLLLSKQQAFWCLPAKLHWTICRN